MSSFDRRLFLVSLAALAGCGLRPVYGPGGSAEGLQGEIAIDPPRDAEGFVFVRQLEDRLGMADNPRFRLSARLLISEEELGITPGQEITRYNVLGRVEYTLRDIDTDAVVASGTSTGFNSYSATGTPFATRSAQTDARERLMISLADQMVARLLATSAEWRR